MGKLEAGVEGVLVGDACHLGGGVGGEAVGNRHRDTQALLHFNSWMQSFRNLALCR